MDGGILAASVAAGAACIGVVGTSVALVKTWNRNGKGAAKEYGELKATVDDVRADIVEVKESQARQETTATAMANTLAEQKTHCAGVVEGFKARITTTEKEIDTIRKTK